MITYFCNHCNIRFDPIPVKVICENLPRDHDVQVNSHGNTSKYLNTVTIFQKKKKKKLNQKVNDPKMTFDPTSVEVTGETLPKDHCIQVP